MGTERLAAFSDGVVAIIITIMVLGFQVPQGNSWDALRPLVPVFLSYVLSFVYVGIYWNNHHHLLAVTKRVNGRVLWANLHLLFWLSLTPFVTNWMGQNHFARVPTAVYGAVLLANGVAYFILQEVIVRVPGQNEMLAQALGNDAKGKWSVALNVLAIGLTWVRPALADGIYVLVALLWLVPDRRLERAVAEKNPPPPL